MDCSALTSIEIPASVTSIGHSVFSSCDNLKEIVVNSDNPTYSSMDGVLYNREKTTLICCLESFTGKFVIPNSVTSIGDYAFNRCSSLTSVEIPNALISIGNYAFSSCERLTSVDIPSSVTTIGMKAFSYCSGLNLVQIPNSITSIGESAFASCNNLKSVYYLAADPIEGTSNIFSDNAYQNATLYILENGYEKAKTIDPWKNFAKIDLGIVYNIIDAENFLCEVSDGKKAYGNVVIPSKVLIDSHEYTVVSIGNSAFNGCSSLTSIEIPNSVTFIGNDAFIDCNSLTSVQIPNSVTSIGTYAFANCSGLTSIEIPNSVTSIGHAAFFSCTSLTSVEIPNSVTSIGTYAFADCSGLTSIEIPNSVTSIGNNAFEYCLRLTSVEIPASVTYIEFGAFVGCSSLTSIQIPYSVTSINDCAFQDCSGLVSVVIPTSVTSIGSYAFINCSSLTSVVIPNSVTSIGAHAFDGCNNLETVYYLAEAPIKGDSDIFSDNVYQNSTLYVSENGYEKARTIDPWKNFTKIETVPNLEFSDIVYTIIDAENFLCEVSDGTKATGDVVIPSKLIIDSQEYTVVSIGNNAFEYCRRLDSVEIPNSVTYIGKQAFYYCSFLTSVEIPNSVTNIGKMAFDTCDNLKEIDVDSDNPAYSSIDGALFNREKSTLIRCPGGFTGEYIIPNSVTSIGDNAFSGCYSLTSVQIPNSVISIGYGAFSSCNSLTSVQIPNSVTTIGEDAFSWCRNITSVQIPNSVTNIDRWAFSNCTSLTSITSLAVVPPSCGISTFNQVDLSKCVLYVPQGSKADYQAADVWKEFPIIYDDTTREFFDFTDELRIRPNESKTLSVAFDITEPVIGFQTDITLPENLSIEETDGKLDIQLGSAAGGTSHSLSAAKVGPGNKYRIIAFSDNNAVFAEGDNLLNITLKAGPAFNGGDILLSGTVISLQGNEGLKGLDYSINLPACIYVSDLSLSPVEATVNVSHTVQLTATIEPEDAWVKDLIWTSSDTDVASVDENGLVTAISTGNAVITATTTDGSELSASATVTVLPILYGDANDNGVVAIDDIVTEVQYILEQDPQPFSFEKADVNHDNIINVVDVTGTVAIILADNDKPNSVRALRAAKEGPDNLSVELVELDSEQKGKMLLQLRDTDDVTALQADIRLPEGISVEDVRMADGSDSDHAVQYAQLGDNRIRFVCYSLTSSPLTTEKPFVEVHVQGDNNFTEDTADVYNVYSSDKDGKLGSFVAVPVTISNNVTTKFVDVEADGAESVEVFNLQGVRIGKSTDRLPAGIYIIRRGTVTEKLVIR